MSSSANAPAQVALVPATLGRRAGAYLIDVAISTVILVVAAVVGVAVAQPANVRDDAALALALLGVYGVVAGIGIAWVVVYTLLQGGKGSVGQRLLRIRLADAATSAPIGFGRALLRNLIWGLAAYVIVGYFSVLFDSSGRRQGWHDKVANALVVNTTDAAVPGPGAAPAPAAAAHATATAVASSLPPVPGSAPVFPAATAFAPPAFAATAVPPVPPLPPAPAPQAPPPVSPAPVSGPEPSRSAPTGPGPMISSVPGITIDPEPAASRGAAPAEPAVGVPAPAPVPRLSPPQVSAPPSSSPSREIVPPTTDDLDLDETRAAPPAAGPELIVLSWDDGTRTAVYTRTLFGRNPTREDGAVVASIRDETLSLSKTHFEIGPGPDGVYVLDRHSTNGTTLVRGGGRQQLVAGTRTTLVAGDVLEFGDRRATVGGRS